MRPSNVSSDKGTNKSFHSALVGFSLLGILLVLSAFFYWPYPSSQPLAVTSYDVERGIRITLETGNLPAGTLMLAWILHFLPFVVCLAFVGLMVIVCRAFNDGIRFTQRAARIFSVIRWILLGGLFIYIVIDQILQFQIRQFFVDQANVSLQNGGTPWSFLGLLLLMTIYFIEGALRRGLTLQQDADATI